MGRIRSKELYEVEELLEEVMSWSDGEIAALPQFYQEKVYEYRQLANNGEEADTSLP